MKLPSPSCRLLLLALFAVSALCIVPAAALATSPFPVNETFQNSTIGSAWHMGGTGSLTAPNVDATGSGWLRLTTATNSQFGYVINDTAFPSSNGIDVSFDYASYGGTGADGLTFFLYDGSTPETSFATGPAGGSLGYASCPSSNQAGLTNAYIGVGFDEWGNFANTGFCGLSTGYASGLQANRVTVRGAATSNPKAANSYPYLTSVPTSESLVGSSRGGARHVIVSVTPDMKLSVYITYPDGIVQTVTSGYQLPTAPSTLKFGWVASTGGSTDYHEIRNSTVAEPADLSTSLVSGPTSASRSGTLTYTFKVANVGQNATTGNAISATSPGGALQNVSWTCASATGTCGATSGTGLPNTTADLPIGASATYTITGQPTSDTSYGSLRLEADPTGQTTQSVPNDNIAIATTDLTPAASSAPSMSLSNTNGYTGTATGTQGNYVGTHLTVTDNWQHCASDGSGCSDIPGATSLIYTTGPADRGYTLRLHEHASNSAGSADAYSPYFSPLPQTRETTSTPAYTNQTSAAFTLSSDTSGVAYECQIDSGSWSACSTTPAYSGLAAGTHTFDARAVYAGLSDTTATGFSWTVDATAPTDTSTCGTPNGQNGWYRSALSCTVSASDDTSVSQVQYYVDSGSLQSGSSGASVSIPDGTHTLYTRARDSAGNYSSWRSISVKVDAAAPTDTSDCGTPTGQGGWFTTHPTCTAAGSDSISGIDHVAYQLDSGQVVTTPSGATSASVPIATDGVHTLKTEVFNAAGSGSGWSSHTIKVDTTAPAAPVVASPAADSVSNDLSPTVTVSGEPNATVIIDVDGADHGPVQLDGSGAGHLTIPGPLALALHSVSARETDQAGNVGPWSSTSRWTVKTQTSIHLSGPTGGPTNVAAPTVGYVGEAGNEFTLTVDGQTVATGVIPSGGAGSLTLPSGLSDGPHTIAITVADRAGNQAADSIVVAIDTAAPAAVQVNSGPAQFTQSRTATFTFSNAKSGVTYQCSLDGASWSPCPSPVSIPGLPDGPHTLLVRALDPAGNTSPSSEYAWTVMTAAPPAPTILGGPASFTLQSPTQFEISSPPGMTLECSLDGNAYQACSGIVGLGSLPLGRHSLAVRATDEAGNTSVPSTYRWTVLRRRGAHGLPRRARLLVAARATAIAGRSFDVGCNLNAGSLKRCVVAVYHHRERIGTGVASESRHGHTHTIVTVWLNALGRRLLARAVDGLPVTLSGSAKPFGFGELSAGNRTVLYEPHRFVVSDVLFDFDSPSLTPGAYAIVRQIAHELGGAQSVVCEGNTDSSGSASYNYGLGLRRAQAVCSELHDLGVDARFSAVSYGALRPVASNRTAAGRHLNRRVLVRVNYHDLPPGRTAR